MLSVIVPIWVKKCKECRIPLFSITVEANNIILHGVFTLCSDFNIFDDDTTTKIAKFRCRRKETQCFTLLSCLVNVRGNRVYWVQ